MRRLEALHLEVVRSFRLVLQLAIVVVASVLLLIEKKRVATLGEDGRPSCQRLCDQPPLVVAIPVGVKQGCIAALGDHPTR